MHPAETMLWQHIGFTLAAIKVGWLDFVVTLVSVYIPPLTSPHRACLVKAGLLPIKAVSLLELCAVLEILDLQQEPVLLMGGFKACITALAPTV